MPGVYFAVEVILQMEFAASSVTQQRAIGSDGDAPASPDLLVVNDETGHEILIFAGGMSGLMQRYADQLVAHANRPVPGAVLGGEKIS